MSDIQRTRKALKIINRKLAAEEWLYGLVGKITPSGPVYDVPGRAGFIYVRLRNANGAQTTPAARNDPGVPHSAGLPVRMYYEGTTLVIDSVSRRPDLATVDPPPASGVGIHIHDDRYFREDEHVNASAGAADAAKPLVLGAAGLLSNTFLDVELSSIAGLTSAADRLPYYTGLGTAALATFTAFARTFLDDADAATVRATLGLIIGTNVQAFDATLLSLAALGTAADRIAYTTGVDTWAETAMTAYGRTLAALADAAALRTSAGLIAGGAGDIWVEKAGDSMSGALNMGSQLITNLATPVSAGDAATKAYVDAIAEGLDIKASVRAATTANITLSGTQTIDGVAVIAGDRVLVKNQTTGADNGIYVVAAGAWARASDASVSAEVTSGMFTFVTEGTVAGNTGWALTTDDPIVLATTALVFSQFSGPTNIAAAIDNAAETTTPADANKLALVVAGVLTWVSWANIKATLKTYFDTLYTAINTAVLLTGAQTKAGILTLSDGIKLGAGTDAFTVYDEGTFTPTIFGSTTAGAPTYTSGGNYTQIGRMMFVSLFISLTNKGTMAGNVRIGGFPVAALGNSHMPVLQWFNLATATVGMYVEFRSSPNGTQADVFRYTAAATSNTAAQPVTDINNNTIYVIEGFYLV